MDGKHFYSTRPENANQKVLVGIHAHTIDILTEEGQVITTHKRVFGDNRSDVSDYTTTLAVLMKNSGAWENSGLRQEPPDVLRTYMDAQPKEKLKDCLRIMNELTNQYGFQAAASAMEMACVRGPPIFVMHRYWLPGSPDMGSLLRQKPVHHWKSTTRHS